MSPLPSTAPVEQVLAITTSRLAVCFQKRQSQHCMYTPELVSRSAQDGKEADAAAESLAASSKLALLMDMLRTNHVAAMRGRTDSELSPGPSQPLSTSQAGASQSVAKVVAKGVPRVSLSERVKLHLCTERHRTSTELRKAHVASTCFYAGLLK